MYLLEHLENKDVAGAITTGSECHNERKRDQKKKKKAAFALTQLSLTELLLCISL